MRVSADKDDPGYANFRGRHHVTLDGRDVPFAVTADEEAGFVERLVTDVHGRLRLIGGAAERETLYGKVVIL